MAYRTGGDEQAELRAFPHQTPGLHTQGLGQQYCHRLLSELTAGDAYYIETSAKSSPTPRGTAGTRKLSAPTQRLASEATHGLHVWRMRMRHVRLSL
jgi:hypothetical protein